MFKKVLSSLLLACFIFVSVGGYFARATHAQESTWYFQNYEDWYTRVYDKDNQDEIFGERYTAAQVEWVIWGIVAFFMNHLSSDPEAVSCTMEYKDEPVNFGLNCGDNIVSVIDTWSEGGLISSASTTSSSNSNLAATTNPVKNILSGERPLSGIGYVRNSLSKFSPVQPVHAQGFGFEAANSMRDLWVAVRNVTYFFLILMIIAMSFLIMFRFKISPQTVITVQSALPKIIGALILITFSYAIAGFLIDLLYVVIGIIAAVLTESHLFLPPEDGSQWSYMYSYLTGANLGQGVVGIVIIYWLLFILISISALFSNIVGALGGGVTLILALIIIVIALLASLFIILKILWLLIKTFVNILLLIAVSPVFIITGGFTGWLKNMASNLAVFAAMGPMFAIMMLFLANALPDSWNVEVPGITENLLDTLSGYIPFHPDATVLGNSTWTPPFFPFGGDLDIVWLFASFVVLTLVPSVANMIKSMIQGKPFGYGSAIGAVLMPTAGLAAKPVTYPAGLIKAGREKMIIGEIESKGWRGIFSAFRSGGSGSGSPCLSKNTLIETPKGSVPVQRLKKGAKVWTLNTSGKRISAKILKVSRTLVSKAHIITHLVLEDGRELYVSPGHPRGDGYTIGDLNVGDIYNGSRVIIANNQLYEKKYTYDILPSGRTGLYWANGILLGSTIPYKPKSSKSNSQEKCLI